MNHLMWKIGLWIIGVTRMNFLRSFNYIEVYNNLLTESECEYYKSILESSKEQKAFNKWGNYVGIAFDLKQDNYVVHKLTSSIEKYKEKYTFLTAFENWGIESLCNIQKFSPGDCYSNEHAEHGPNPWDCKRVLTWMIYLNTIRKDGGTRWPQQKYTSKAKSGSLILWPAGWTHSHHGIPSKHQEKYIMTGWCSFI